MKPLNLEFEAFLSYKDKTEIDFTRFDNSLFLIDGITGAGKTTIFDAICFALYGKLSDEERDDDLKSDFADDKTECYVKLTFLQGGEKYTIYRKPRQERLKKNKKNSTELTTNNEEVEFITPNKTYTKIKEANQKILEIVNFDINQFRQTMMIAQGKFSELVRADTDTRSELFREILMTRKFDDFKNKIKEKYDDAKDKSKTSTDLMDNHLRSFISDDDQTKKLLTIEHPSNNDFDTLSNLLKHEVDKEYQEYDNISKELNEKRQEETKLNTEITKIDTNNQNLDSYNVEKTKYDGFKAKENEFKSLSDLINEYEDSKKVKDLYLKYEEKDNDLKAKEDDSKKNQETKDELDEKIVPVKDNYNKIQSHQDEFNQNTSKIDKLNDIKDLFKTKAAEGKKLEAQNKKLHEKEKSLKQNEDTIVVLKDEIQKLNDEIEKNKGIDVIISNTENEISQINLDIKDINEIKKKYNQYLLNFKKYEEETIKTKESCEAWKVKNVELTDAEITYRLNIAGILAEKLDKDTPCPVCGSKEHPHCATKSNDTITEDELEKLRKKVQNLNDVFTKNTSSCANLKGKVEADLKNILGSLQIDESQTNDINKIIAKKESENVKKLKDANTRKCSSESIKHKCMTDESTIKSKQKEVDDLESKKNDINEEIKIIENEISKIKGSISQLIKSIDDKEEDKIDEEIKDLNETNNKLQNTINDYRNTYNDLNNKIASVSSLISKIGQDIKDITVKKEQAYKDFKTSLDSSILKDIDKINDCLNSHDQKYIDTSKKELDEFNTNLKASKTVLDRYLTQGYDKLTYQDKTSLESKRSDLGNIIHDLENKKTDIKSKYDKNKSAYDNYIKEFEANKELNIKTGLLDSLYKVASGNVSGKPKIDFETYYQSQIFSQILDIASRKLDDMTSGRYQMQRHIDDKDKSNNALDIDIFDTMTGKLRASNSLSGGETFMAALSLALGFSEFSRTKVGARELDCMFIDEGFGTLDSDSLNDVIKVLKNLSNQNNRMIGIISHVDSLENMISKKINVIKTGSGSKLTITD